MDCRDVQDRLDDLLGGRLTAEERRPVEEHLRRCPDCRGLEALVRRESKLPAVEPPPGLAESILASTSGSPCARARELLCDFVDQSLEDVDAELVRLHLEACQECAALSRAVARMTEDLPMLADLEPDARFVDDVLAATLPFRTRLARRLFRLPPGWVRLFQRPRFALEGAYIGTFILVLVFGTPGSPFAGMPRQALEMAKTNPVEKLKGPVTELEAGVSSGVQSARQDLRKKMAGVSRELATGLTSKSSNALESVKEYFGTLWERLTSEQETDDDKPSPGPREVKQ